MIKRTGLLAVVLTTGILFTACAKNSNLNNGVVVTTSLKDKEVLVGNIPCEFPLSKDEKKLNILTTIHEDIDPENIFVWKKYEEMTGIGINWISTTKQEREEKVYTSLVNKSDIDLITRCKLSSNVLTQYGESGLILNLAKDDMLKNYAPNCWAYLQSHPDTLASVMNPDGSIYALPQINSGPELRVSRKLFINKRWLENVNMQVPTTTEEFYQLLKAFKEQDANGNGDPNDEIPFTSQDWASIQESLFGAFGLANRGVHNTSVDFDENTGKARFIAQTDAYKDFLEYTNKLYSEGLIDSYIFTTSREQWENNVLNDRVGVFANTNLATMPADKINDWVAVEDALTGPNGDQLWTAIRANFHSTGAAVIPTACDEPELVLRWLDYFWTDEGTLFYHMGIENETFCVKDDGTYDYLPFVYDEISEKKLPFDDVVALYSQYPGGSNPTVEIAPYFRGGEMAEIPAQAARKLYEYGPKEYWPSFTFTADENDKLEILQSDLSKFITTNRIDFITGNRPFTQWDDYVAQLKELGAEEFLSIYQTAVDRYYALKEEYEK